MDDRYARGRLAGASCFSELTGEHFGGLDLSSVHPNHIRFERCSFVAADLRQATLDSCSFRYCDLSQAKLRGSSLRFVQFTGCILDGADLRDCDLTGARFDHANTGDQSGRTTTTGVLLDGAILTDVTISDVVGWPAR